MTAEKPEPPDLPKTLREPLERQPPDRLDQVSTYADQLAHWKRAEREAREVTETRERDSITDDEQTTLEERGISIDPTDYEGVATSGAYITVKGNETWLQILLLAVARGEFLEEQIHRTRRSKKTLPSNY